MSAMPALRAKATSIPSALITWCDAVARATALLLSCCEHRYPDGRSPSTDDEAEALLDAAAERAADWFSALPAPGSAADTLLRLPWAHEPRASLAPLELRLARLVLSKWAGTVRPGESNARPDVLALTNRLLTNPESAYTYHVARFSLLAGLRSGYGVSHDEKSLGQLRAAYNALRYSDISLPEHGGVDARYCALILDVLHVEGWLPRRLSPDRAEQYYQRFARHPLGVPADPNEIEQWDGVEGIRSRLPDFGTLVSLIFAHPTAVPGLDFVSGGLLPTVQNPDTGLAGGLVTLISGPPGTGKTSLCLTLGSRMAELGSAVSYVTTEEDGSTLESKRQSLIDPLSISFATPLSCVEMLAAPSFDVIDGSRFTTLEQLSELLRASVRVPDPAPDRDDPAGLPQRAPRTLRFSLLLPRVVIIDSVTALLQLAHDRPAASAAASRTLPERQRASGVAVLPSRTALRRSLAQTLQELRRLGVCVILVGGEEVGRDESLSYLVDNVIALGVVEGEDRSHPMLSLSLEKTRLQNTHRERHVFHLAGPDGPTVSPSLHAVLRRLDRLPLQAPDRTMRAFVWESEEADPDLREAKFALTLPRRAQTLVYGYGASGKSRFAMSLAIEPRVPVEPGADFEAYLRSRSRQGFTEADPAPLGQTRVLVVSFQYGAEYYRELAGEILKERFRCDPDLAGQHVDVIDFYPGEVDAESVVRKVRMRLRRGEVDGTPHTAVVLDGVHNITAQFPALVREPLLWPTLYRLFRTHGIDTVTTFTFFRIPAPHQEVEVNPASRRSLHRAFDESRQGPTPTLRDAERHQFQTLITSCDYSFVVEPPIATRRPELRNVVRIQLSSSPERSVEAPIRIIWDADRFAQMHPRGPDEDTPASHRDQQLGRRWWPVQSRVQRNRP